MDYRRANQYDVTPEYPDADASQSQDAMSGTSYYCVDEGFAATAAPYPSQPSRYEPSFPLNTTSYASSSNEWRASGNARLNNNNSNQNNLPTRDFSVSPGNTDASGSDATYIPHNWEQVGSITSSKALTHLVVDVSSGETKSFLCGWSGCQHPLGFNTKTQLITHIRSVHLQEKPFQCTTCQTSFARKQDAIRHVESANSGERYKCNICNNTFARKSYRDSHQNLCVERRAVLAGYPVPRRYVP